jgi:glycosyltransferase involved in cell wall biosynthesis
MNPFVSVVIPTYNHANFLGRALQSVLDQTYPNWEALVIDNHSQDNTSEVVKSFGDPRIRLLKIHNQGVIAASRNMGMREANGEWIAFLDSDDFWYPKKLETIMTAVESNDAFDVLSNDELKVDIKTGVKKVLRYGPYQKDFYKVLLVEGNRLSPSATLVRRDFLVQHGIAFDESQDYVTVEDYGLWLNLAYIGARFKFIHDVQGEYIIHGANNSAGLERHWRNVETLLHDHVFKIQQFHPSPDQLWKLVYPRLNLVKVRHFFVNGQLWMAFKLALETLFNFPNGTTICLLSKLKKHSRKMSP